MSGPISDTEGKNMTASPVLERASALPPSASPAGSQGASRAFAAGGANAPGPLRSFARKVTIKQKLWALAVIAVLVFLMMTVIGMTRVNPLLEQNDSSATTTNAIAAMNSARNSWVHADEMTIAVLVGTRLDDTNPGFSQTLADGFETSYAASLKSLDTAIALVKDSNPPVAEAFTRLREQVADYHDAIQAKAIKQAMAGKLDAATQTTMIKAGDAYAEIDKGFSDLTKSADAATATNIQESTDSLTSLRTSLMIVALIGGILFIAISFAIIRSITQPLQKVVDSLLAIARGDRSVRVNHPNQDEIGSISVSVDQVIESLDAADEATAAAPAARAARLAAEQQAAIEKSELEARSAEEKAAAELERREREAQIEREQREADERQRDAERSREQAEAEAERERAAEIAIKAEDDARRVGLMLTYAQSLAAGDLAGRLDVDGEDSLGQVAEALRKLAASLRSSMSQIGQTSAGLSSASSLLAGMSGDMDRDSSQASDLAGNVSAAAEQVSANIATVATAAEEMTASIREIASNASDASTVAASAVRVADQVRTTVTSLDESSSEISQVIALITSIAQQTNLLALNATIEAARAGDLGKGFAVVANEVKELAAETAKATEEIGRRIEAIQGDTAEAVSAIGEVTSVIGQINDITGTIAAAVEEQTATTNEIARSVTEAATGATGIAEDITKVARAAAATQQGAQGTSTSASELAEMAGSLDRLVGGFRY
jgi:methyl-accepting chemotaxis protein